jgi:hypothetical protein
MHRHVYYARAGDAASAVTTWCEAHPSARNAAALRAFAEQARYGSFGS